MGGVACPLPSSFGDSSACFGPPCPRPWPRDASCSPLPPSKSPHCQTKRRCATSELPASSGVLQGRSSRQARCRVYRVPANGAALSELRAGLRKRPLSRCVRVHFPACTLPPQAAHSLARSRARLCQPALPSPYNRYRHFLSSRHHARCLCCLCLCVHRLSFIRTPTALACRYIPRPSARRKG